ncbi:MULTISPECIES: 5'-nucleotidase C-terminal domain-containing protein [unclassified Blastococcus]
MRRTRLSLTATLAASAVVVGLPAVASAAPVPDRYADVPVQLLAINDFHGRISETTGSDATLVTGEGPGPDGVAGTADDGTVLVGGAASLASTVEETRAAFVQSGGNADSSLFVSTGDLIGASPFDSSVFQDEPTIEVFNALGLDVSVVGNHEFDRGTDELRRISAATDGTFTDDVEACEGVEVGVTGCFEDSTGNAFRGADFPYLAANVYAKGTDQPILPPYQVFDVAGGKKIALIGVVTDTTPTIVSPTGIADVDFGDEAEAVNRWVPELREQGIEAIGVLLHEGGENTGEDAADFNGCDELTGPVVDINDRVSPAVDLIVSSHSHASYSCLVADPAGQPRLITQAGSYGRLVSDIRLTLDGRTGDVQRGCDYRAANVPVLRDNPDAEIAGIVEYWDERSAEAGDRVVGTASEDIRRAGTWTTDPTTGQQVFRPVRDGESSLGNLVAQMQLEALQVDPAYGDPVLAFMNPGGLRADIEVGEVTYAELFTVQPFGNTVNAITLTGADIRAVLEQQFQSDQPRASTLRLGTSEGFSYRFDTANPYGQRVDPASITLDPDGSGPLPAEVVDPAASYRVAANSFLIAGGDSFTAFTNGTDPATGPVDVETAVAYFEAASGPVAPPAADHGQPGSFPLPPVATGLSGTDAPAQPPAVADGTSAVAGPCDATATLSTATPDLGDVISVTVADFGPREKVTAVLSDGRRLAEGRTDAQGTATMRFPVPKRAPAGEYTVTVTGTSGEWATTTFTLG